MIVGNPIIMILKAILNWFRLRRDYIANAVDKIPPEIKDALVAWYSPCKQKLTNYDVIESYSEDFTKWTKNGNVTSAATVNNNSIVINGSIKGASIFKKSNTSMQSINIIASGVKNGDNVEYRCVKNGVLQYIPIVNGINKLPASELTENPDFNIGFVLNINSTGIINLKQLPTSILKDFSGNGNHAYLYGGKGKLNSGMGLYKVDFTSWRFYPSFSTIEYYHNKLVIKKAPDSKNLCAHTFTDKFTAKISNIPDGTNLYYRYYDRINKKNVSILLHNGINEIDYTNADGSIDATNMFIISKDVDFNITIEQIPDYPDQLCYDGKMYAVCYDFPILTDYTVMAERTWFERQNRACFLSKITISGTGAFGFEFYNEYNEDTTYSFGRVNNVEQFKDGITYQITNSYNGIVKLDYVVNGKDNAELYIGKLRPSERPAFIGCHGDIFLFNRTLTDDELDLVKEHFFGIVRIKDALMTTDKKYLALTNNNYIKLNK